MTWRPGLLVLGVVLLVPVGSASERSDFAFTDPIGDVTRGGDPYEGDGADTTDVVWVQLIEQPKRVVFYLGLRELSRISDETRNDGFHAQYAVSFVTRAGHAGYSTRAMFGGEEYTQAPDGAWRFQIHDKQKDEWPTVTGYLDGSTLVWSVPWTMLGLDLGTTLSEWSVQTWNSYERLDQYGDWASTTASYTLGQKETAVVAGDSAEAEPPVFVPALPIGLALLGIALVVGRRR